MSKSDTNGTEISPVHTCTAKSLDSTVFEAWETFSKLEWLVSQFSKYDTSDIEGNEPYSSLDTSIVYCREK